MATHNPVSSWTRFPDSAARAGQGTVAARWIVPFARFLFVSIFLMAGPFHFSHVDIDAGAAAGVPWPGLLVPLSGLIAFAGALSILLGYHAKIGGWLLVLFLFPVTFAMHNFWAVKDAATAQMQMAMFMKNISLVGAALLITQFGAGPSSLDARHSIRQ